MNKVFEKIIEKLEAYSDADEAEQYGTIPVIELDRAIEIVMQEAEQYNGGWIPCSGCADCEHKECDNYGKV